MQALPPPHWYLDPLRSVGAVEGHRRLGDLHPAYVGSEPLDGVLPFNPSQLEGLRDEFLRGEFEDGVDGEVVHPGLLVLKLLRVGLLVQAVDVEDNRIPPALQLLRRHHHVLLPARLTVGVGDERPDLVHGLLLPVEEEAPSHRPAQRGLLGLYPSHL